MDKESLQQQTLEAIKINQHNAFIYLINQLEKDVVSAVKDGKWSTILDIRCYEINSENLKSQLEPHFPGCKITVYSDKSVEVSWE